MMNEDYMNLYNCGNIVVNNFVYKIKDGCVMIDTGYENYLCSVLTKLKKHNIEPEEIRYIFLTHAHDDHAGFLNEFLNKYPDVKVICSDKSLETLRKGQNSFEGGCSTELALIFCNIMKLFGKGKHLFPKLESHNENKIIQVSDQNRGDLQEILNGKIIETPGHTKDSISLLHESGNLFCGDAAMNGFPSSHRITIWVENKEDFIESWKKIIELKPAAIYPAHGKKFDYHDLEKNMKNLEKIKLRRLKY